EVTVANHGLIAAEDVTLTVTDNPDYILTPLVTNLGTLRANSEITIPVLVARRAALTAAKVAAFGEGCAEIFAVGANGLFSCLAQRVGVHTAVDIAVETGHFLGE